MLETFLGKYSANTRLAYARDLRDFARYLGVPTPGDAVAALLDGGSGRANLVAFGYRKHLEDRGLSAASVARPLAALRSVVELAGRLGRCTWSLRVDRPRPEPYRDTRGPGRDGWRGLVDRVNEEKKLDRNGRGKAFRDLAIIRLLHDLMLRRSEVVGLDVEHVELEMGRPAAIWILGKGRSARERLELPPSTALALGDWLVARGREPGPVFVPLDRLSASSAPTRLTGRSVARVVNRLGERAELPRRVAPHGLRHEAITRAVEMGESLIDVQRAARHKDPRTTQVYIDRHKNPQRRISRLISED
ncbi:MAG: tyrosine-type recombinase/integrase [Candidatus Limnocylindrales bacterium]